MNQEKINNIETEKENRLERESTHENIEKTNGEKETENHKNPTEAQIGENRDSNTENNKKVELENTQEKTKKDKDKKLTENNKDPLENQTQDLKKRKKETEQVMIDNNKEQKITEKPDKNKNIIEIEDASDEDEEKIITTYEEYMKALETDKDLMAQEKQEQLEKLKLKYGIGKKTKTPKEPKKTKRINRK
ncbi:DNA ligase 1-like [Centruroides vittatus]|uniref:DNA ligase 1-like n=1 Tax=Centruroides vittatus TaxID=120091 RepID=UPI0035100F73